MVEITNWREIMKADLFLHNAQIATDFGVFSGGIAVKDGKVLKLVEGDEAFQSEESIDLAGKLILPGLVDAHVHFNEPGNEHWEGFMAGSMAAAAGGVTTVIEMPFNATPPTRNISLLNTKLKAIQDKSVIDYGLWGLLDDSNLNDLEALHNGGVVGFKGFLCDPGVFEMVHTYQLHQAMNITKKLGSVIGVHAEDDSLGKGFTQKLIDDGRKDPAAWAESHPPIVEMEAIQQAILIARETGARLHIVHVTIPQGIDAIQRAKAEGVQITGETCPHYLSLNTEDLSELGSIAKCGPPLRNKDLVEQLWQRVVSGRVDTIGSDHCPCPPEMKFIPDEDIFKAWGGITGIQTMLPVLFTEGVHKRSLALSLLVRMTSLNPSKLFGLYPRKGHLLPGADADIVVFDPNREWTLSNVQLLSRHKISPFVGKSFKGSVLRTYVRGRLVYKDGDICAEPGFGQFLKWEFMN
jgi:allantoinase